MKKTTLAMLLAALIIMLMASCKSTYPGNYSKYNWHGYQLRKQVDSLYKSDTTGRGLVAMVNGKLVLIYK